MSLAIAGTVISVGGSALQAREQNKYADRVVGAQAAVSGAEAERQKGYRQRSERYATDAQGKFTRQSQEQQLEEAVARRSADATAAISGQTPYEAGEGTPNIVNETMAKSISEALARGKSSTQKLAALSAYGDLGLGNKIALNTSGQKIATEQGFAAGSNALLPFELQASAAGVKKPGILPGVVSMLGQGLSMYGAGGGSLMSEGPRPAPTFVGPMPSTFLGL